MVSMIMRMCAALTILALAAPGLTAQEEMGEEGQEAMAQDTAMEMPGDTAEHAMMRPIPAGVYTFVPEESDSIEGMIREAVDHMFFAIRGIARGRLAGANEQIHRVDLSYRGDTLLVNLREGEPTVKTLMNGDTLPYTRADGEVVQVTTEVEPGMIDMYFISDDGEKEMIYDLRADGHLALESITYSEKLEEPFRYTWVYAPPEEDEGMGEGMDDEMGDRMDEGDDEDPGEGTAYLGKAGSGSPAAVRPTLQPGAGGTLPGHTVPELMGRPVHTYSIVARDAETGQLGVAVQSHWFSVGPLVVWAEPGVGAVATQSFVDPSYGPLGLELMGAGKTASQALTALVEADEHPEVRQVAMVDAHGNVGVHTGSGAIHAAGHETGSDYSVQANLMLSETVPSAMARAYENTDGDLTARLMAALEAAQAEGGDIRGKQSAAILVVSGEKVSSPWEGRIVDLRVEDHPEPVQELRRLVELARAYEHMNAGDEALTEGDVERALKEYSTAQEMVPDEATNGEMAFWHAATLASLGRVEESLPLFRRAFAQDENWRTLVPRLVDAGQFPDDDALVRRITEVEPR